MKDPYKSPLKIPEGTSGRYDIKHVTIPEGTKIPIVNIRTAIMTGQKPQSIVYDVPVTHHHLCEDGGIWMSDQPCELFQHNALLKRFSGRILVGGLGLGYAATILSKNPKVTEVVVIERSTDVVSLVWEHVKTRKMKLIIDDLFNYLTNATKGYYDYAYYDIWASDGESTMIDYILPLRKASRLIGLLDSRIKCWQEDVMRGQTVTQLLLQIQTVDVPGMGSIPNLDEKRFEEIFSLKYHKHVKPFWKWYRSQKPNQSLATEKAVQYCKLYGTKNWIQEWSKWIGGDII